MKYQCSTKFLSLLACGTLQMGMIPGLAADKSELLKIHDTLSNHENRISHLENIKDSGSRQSSDKKLSVNLKNTASDKTAANSASIYRVQDGDTATKIAGKKNVKLSALLAANGLSSTSVLRIGQSLKIPGSNTVAPVKTTQTKSNPGKSGTGSAQTVSRKESVKVNNNDTLYSLARKYETTVDAIKAMNPGIDETKLRPGSVLLVPVKTVRSTTVSNNQAAPVTNGQTKPVKNLAPAINLDLASPEELHPSPKNIAPQPISSQTTAPKMNPVQPTPPISPKSPVVNKAADLYGTQEYQTVAGETWQTVARDFGTSVDTLRHYNGAVAGSELTPGTFIRVPSTKYDNSADLR